SAPREPTPATASSPSSSPASAGAEDPRTAVPGAGPAEAHPAPESDRTAPVPGGASSTALPAAVPPPPRPADMARDDEAGAVAAAMYFLSLFAYGAATGDVAEWDTMSASGCLGCAGFREEM